MVVTDRLVVLEVVVESKTSIWMSDCLASFQYTVAELWSWDFGLQYMREQCNSIQNKDTDSLILSTLSKWIVICVPVHKHCLKYMMLIGVSSIIHIIYVFIYSFNHSFIRLKIVFYYVFDRVSFTSLSSRKICFHCIYLRYLKMSAV